MTHCSATETREGQTDAKMDTRKVNMAGRRGTERVKDQERVKWSDGSERYLSWRDLWKTETQRLDLFVISCQPLLVYNPRVKSDMTVYLPMTGKPFLQCALLS